jgi:hypothetical protein
MPLDNNDLIGEMDAQVWVNHWMEAIAEHPKIPTDEETMLGWFANAIMAGFDRAILQEQSRSIVDKLREIIYQAAGAATQPLMQDHPHYVFPAERVHDAIEEVCIQFGIPNNLKVQDKEKCGINLWLDQQHAVPCILDKGHEGPHKSKTEWYEERD